jgi:hypothetical protein
MHDHVLSAAEATAVIVVNAVRNRAALCIPGATDVRPPADLASPSSQVIDVNGVEARPKPSVGGPAAD